MLIFWTNLLEAKINTYHKEESGNAGFVAILIFLGGVGLAVLLRSHGSPLQSAQEPVKQTKADPAIVALAEAARRHGIDPVMLIAIAKWESAKTFSPLVGPKSSSAQGLCQMIKDTRKKYGLGKLRYNRNKDGPFISYLINNSEMQAEACAKFTKDQMAIIEDFVGRKPTMGEVYACHLLGINRLYENGCKRTIKASPGTKTRSVVSRGAWNANPFIRRAKTVRQFRIATSKLMRSYMQSVSVPPGNVCRP